MSIKIDRGAVGSQLPGQILAFAIAVFVSYIAWDLGQKGYDWLVGTIATIDVAALGSVFLET